VLSELGFVAQKEHKLEFGKKSGIFEPNSKIYGNVVDATKS
jgi:hypothetical protein